MLSKTYSTIYFLPVKPKNASLWQEMYTVKKRIIRL